MSYQIHAIWTLRSTGSICGLCLIGLCAATDTTQKYGWRSHDSN